MKQSVTKTGWLLCLAAALAMSPLGRAAQSTNAPAKTKAAGETRETSKAQKPKGAHSFRGKLVKVDKTAKTIKVGQSVYHISSETKLMKGEKAATLEDGVVGELVTGYVKPDEQGRMVASSVYFGGKNGKASSKAKPRKSSAP